MIENYFRTIASDLMRPAEKVIRPQCQTTVIQECQPVPRKREESVTVICRLQNSISFSIPFTPVSLKSPFVRRKTGVRQFMPCNLIDIS